MVPATATLTSPAPPAPAILAKPRANTLNAGGLASSSVKSPRAASHSRAPASKRNSSSRMA